MEIQEPVTLEEAKKHLRVEIEDDDSYIGTLISVAREYAEKYQNRLIAERTYGPDEVPSELAVEPAGAVEKQAMLLLIGHWYEHREAVNIGNITSEIPITAEALLSFNRKIPL